MVRGSVPARVGPPRKANSTSLGSEREAISPGGDISIFKVGMRLRNIDEHPHATTHTEASLV